MEQPELSMHPPAQIVPAQTLGVHATVCADGQPPLPSQSAPSVAVLPVQLAARHAWLAPG